MSSSSITPHELIEETAKCSQAGTKSNRLLENIENVRNELLMINGFLSRQPQMREVPTGKIQEILHKYQASDGEACKRAIEEQLRHYVEKVSSRVEENKEVLESARRAKARPLAEIDRPLKKSPEARNKELASVIEAVEHLQERLSGIARSSVEEPVEQESKKRTVIPESEEPLPIQRRKVSSLSSLPAEGSERRAPQPELSLPERIEKIEQTLAEDEENSRAAVKRPKQEQAGNVLLRLYHANQATLEQAQELLREGGVEEAAAQRLQKKIVSLQTLQDSLRGILSSLPIERSTQQPIPGKKGPRSEKVADFASLERGDEEERKAKEIEQAVRVQSAVYKEVVLPASRQLQEEQHRAQERLQEKNIQESRTTRRWLAATGAVGTVGAFLVSDVSHAIAIAAQESTVVEGLAAGAGALTQLNPYTQLVAAGAVAVNEVPSWDWTQRITGVAAGIAGTCIFGPVGGFAVGTAAGRYGPRAAAAVSSIVNPALRRLAKNKILARLRGQHKEEPPPSQ